MHLKTSISFLMDRINRMTTNLMRNDFLADSSDLQLGLGALVLSDGKVQSDVDDRQNEESEEGRDQQQWLVEHRESNIKRVARMLISFDT